MSLSLSALAAMMTMRRRSDDPDSDGAIARYAKQVAPMVTAVLVAVGGFKYAPLPESHEQMALRKDVAALSLQAAKTEAALQALTDRMDDVYSRRTAQVADIEARVRACEMYVAGEKGAKK